MKTERQKRAPLSQAQASEWPRSPNSRTDISLSFLQRTGHSNEGGVDAECCGKITSWLSTFLHLVPTPPYNQPPLSVPHCWLGVSSDPQVVYLSVCASLASPTLY